MGPFVLQIFCNSLNCRLWFGRQWLTMPVLLVLNAYSDKIGFINVLIINWKMLWNHCIEY
jgi:hypothetical protein